MRAPWFLLLLLSVPLTAEAAPVTECQNLTLSDTYTLQSNVNSTGTCFRIQAHNVTLNCAGFTINYSQSSTGNAVDANTFAASNVTIENCRIVQVSTQANSHAINYGGDDGVIRNNTIAVNSTSDAVALASGTERTWVYGNNITTGNGQGIEFNGGDYNNFTDNTVVTREAGGYGVSLRSSANFNHVVNNTITTLDTSIPGMILDGSIGLTIINNTITSNSRGIWLFGTSSATFVVQNITGNTLNGRPILNVVNQDNYVFENNNTLGQLIIANSTNVTVRNLNWQNASVGLYHANYTVRNNTLTGLTDAPPLEIHYSHGYVFNNSINATGAEAFLLRNLNGNVIYNNTISSSEIVIDMSSSNSNKIHNNTITGSGAVNRYPITLSNSQYNEIFGNTIATLSTSPAINSGGADHNTITSNAIAAQGSTATAIYLSGAVNWTIAYNTINTNYHGIEVDSNSNAVIAYNNISATGSTRKGISLAQSGSYLTLYGNRITSQSSNAISLTGDGGSTLYDNYFFSNSSTAPVLSDTDANTWNTTRANSTNIIGGPARGGNWYGNAAGTGWSQNCTDADLDAFCDTPYTIASGNIDYLVLTNDSTPWFSNLTPTGQTFSPGENVSIGVAIREGYIDTIVANVTLPNGSVEPLTLAQQGSSHNASYLAPNLLGTYAVSIYANDTTGKENATSTTFIVNDTTAPTFSIVATPSGTVAVLDSNASEASNLSVEYGTTAGLGALSSNATVATNLTVTLGSLASETLYYYNATRCDAYGNCNTTGTFNFTTLDITAPGQTLTASATNQSAVITRNASEASNLSINYGATDALGTLAANASELVNLTIALLGLEPSTLYYYNATSCDGSGNCATTSGNFTTASNVPAISDIVAASGTTTATITWTTNFPSNSSVSYGITAQLGSEASSNVSAVDHSIELTGLSEGTTYSFNVTSCTPTACNTTGPGTFATGSSPVSTSAGGRGGVVPSVTSRGGTFTLNKGFGRYAFQHGGSVHYVRIKELLDDRVTVTFTSDPVDVTLREGEGRNVDITGDSIVDVHVRVNSISGSSASFTIAEPQEVQEERPVEPPEPEPAPVVRDIESSAPDEPAPQEPPAVISEEPTAILGLLIALLVLVLLGGIWWFARRR